METKPLDVCTFFHCNSHSADSLEDVGAIML